MLQDFLTHHRAELIARCRQKVSLRSPPGKSQATLGHGVPTLIDQLVQTLRSSVQEGQGYERDQTNGTSAQPVPKETAIRSAALLHGRDLLRSGFTIDQVVHDYGDLCQAVTELALETGAKIEVDEFRILNGCLDEAIAGAVTEYSSGHDTQMSEQGVDALNERQGFLAHEMRNLINRATLAISVIKVGDVGLKGATGAILDHSLFLLRELIDRSLAEVRTTAGLPTRKQRLLLCDFIRDVSRDATLEARAANRRFEVEEVDPDLIIEVDRDLLFSATTNLLQNAFKFTAPHTSVSLKAGASGDRILIDIADHCGGLPPGNTENLFQPFMQAGENRTGLGLGLAICRHNVEANDGRLTVRDVPGTGCVFSISLPRQRLS